MSVKKKNEEEEEVHVFSECLEMKWEYYTL